MSEIDPRDFGRLESEVKSLHILFAAQNAALSIISQQLDSIKATMAEARGGWRTLLWLGGSAAAAGGFISWVLQQLQFK